MNPNSWPFYLNKSKSHKMTHYEKNQEKRDQLRSQFAGLAMQRLIGFTENATHVAKLSVAFADALLNELEKAQS